MPDLQHTDWNKIPSDEAYRLSQAEFKGTVVQALQDLDKRMDRIENKEDAKSLIGFGISAFMGGLAGLISTHLGIPIGGK